MMTIAKGFLAKIPYGKISIFPLRFICFTCLYLMISISACADTTAPVLTIDGVSLASTEPYISIDPESGHWEYVDKELSVSIIRHSDQIDKKNVTWYETEIECSEQAKLTSLLTTHGKVKGHSFCSPDELADLYDVVLAFNDDFYASRWYNKKAQGIIIRNGEIMSDKTFKNDANAFPHLEVLALFEDGSMRTFKSKEHTAKEYLDMGVTDTYAFGPILVREGELGERMTDKNYSPYREPRCALGMIEPNHYIVLTVEGRTNESKGVRLRWLADKMLELGAIEALNLDGGNTTYLIFMGEIINLPKEIQKGRLRRVGSLIGVGVGKNVSTEPAK